MLNNTRYRIFYIVVAVCLAIAFLLTVSLYKKNAQSTFASPLINKPLPSFQLKSQTYQLDNNDFLSKLSFLHIWAPWCQSCKDNHQWLELVKKDFDVNIFGIGYRCSEAELVSFNQVYGKIYHKNVADRNGRVGIHLGTLGTPELLIIDAHGIVKFKFSGKIDKEIFYSKILPVIKRNLKHV